MPEVSAAIARKLGFLSQFNLTVEHRPGSKYQNADALSRLIPCMEGPNGEPFSQCNKRVLGHSLHRDRYVINTVSTRNRGQSMFGSIMAADIRSRLHNPRKCTTAVIIITFFFHTITRTSRVAQSNRAWELTQIQTTKQTKTQTKQRKIYFPLNHR